MPSHHLKRNFFLRIVLPTLLAFILFIITIFVFIIPVFERNLLKGKQEMIRELTNSTWSILEDFNHRYEDGAISLNTAQEMAVKQIKQLRYGEENKDYFWITDQHPNMIMHPYRPELDGTDLSDYSDPGGKKLFVAFVETVRTSGEGFVEYLWQWKDDSTKIVPKLSFVREFKPWGWIVGTGIYIEDVKQEIGNLTGNLIYASFAILVVLGSILFYIGRQSFKIESERQSAEEGLKESESKYKALVEASTDGLIMILDGQFVYANQVLLEMLGYERTPDSADLYQILCKPGFDSVSGIAFIKRLLESGTFTPQFEGKLITKQEKELSVILYTSEIHFGDKQGFTIIVKDVSAGNSFYKELDEDFARFNTMINNIDIGVFRCTLGKNSTFIEANDAAVKIFGFSDKTDLLDTKLKDLFHNREELDTFFEKVKSGMDLKNNALQIRKKDGSTSIVSISAVLVEDKQRQEEVCDGIIEDITNRIKLDEERENLIVELQTSLKFLHQPLDHFLSQIVSCSMNAPIHQAAKIITKHKYSAALVQSDNGDYLGIITDHDLRKRVVAENIDMKKPVFNVMSSPLITVPSNSLVFEALIQMHENSVRHLAVKDNNGQIVGIISSEELLTVERQSSAYLLREIEISDSLEELSEVKRKLPWLIKTLIDSGAKSKNISHIITTVFDALVFKLIEFALKDQGEPPARFCFVALGSAGRKEQTLISDQDNAIIFETVSKEKLGEVKSYFDKLAQKVCYGLNECGYAYCTGEAMAKNPKWTQPIEIWIDYFHKWIATSTQQDLIDISIYFDFRHVYGESALTDNLRDKLTELTENQSGFFQHLTKNCLLHKPPVGILGKLVLESKGKHAETFDIKMATMPISDFARIYALKHNLPDTNTLERLQALFKKGVINKNSYDEIFQAYNFLMQLRFRHQAKQITDDEPVDNYIHPNELTQIELKTLKNTFSQIIGIQKRLSNDFGSETL